MFYPVFPDLPAESAVDLLGLCSKPVTPQSFRNKCCRSYRAAKHFLVADEFGCMLIYFASRNISSRGIALSFCLTKEEIKELTQKVRYGAQVRALSEMGIHHTLRPDGSPVVLHSTLSEVVGSPKRKPSQPDFSSLKQ